MAEALARGIIQSGAIAARNIFASDVSSERQALFRDSLGAHAGDDNLAVVRDAEILVLCVKPQQADAVAAQIAPAFNTSKHLLASICAGVSCARLEAQLPAGARVVRVMP